MDRWYAHETVKACGVSLFVFGLGMGLLLLLTPYAFWTDAMRAEDALEGVPAKYHSVGTEEWKLAKQEELHRRDNFILIGVGMMISGSILIVGSYLKPDRRNPLGVPDAPMFPNVYSQMDEIARRSAIQRAKELEDDSPSDDVTKL